MEIKIFYLIHITTNLHPMFKYYRTLRIKYLTCLINYINGSVQVDILKKYYNSQKSLSLSF